MPEVNETRPALAVLICIMAFAVVSGIGFAVSQTITNGQPKPSVDNAVEVLKVWIQKIALSADPISDPRPNRMGR